MTQLSNAFLQGRHCGVDFLRIVAMFMICALHVDDAFGAASSLPAVKLGTIWVEAFCIIGVNLFALVTGYVCVAGAWKIGRFFRLWLQVVFYAVGFYLLRDALIVAGWLHGDTMSIRGWLNLSLPIPLASCYWYFTAYAALFLLIPFVNSVLTSWSRGRFAALLAVCLIVLPYAMLWTVGCCRGGLGHNALWLLIMYIAGAYARLHPVNIPRKWLILGYAIGTGMTLTCYLWRFAPFANYFFPPIVLSSICMFLLFARMEIRNSLLIRLIALLAPFSFGVYLVHCHPWVYGNLMPKYYAILFENSGYSWCFFWFSCIILYLSCSLVDAVRACLFRLCRVNALADSMERCLLSTWKILSSRMWRIFDSWFA